MRNVRGTLKLRSAAVAFPQSVQGKGCAVLTKRESKGLCLVLIPFLLVGSSFVLGQACPGGTPGCVQANSASGWGASSTSVTLTNNVVSGNTLAVGIEWGSSTVTISS